MMGQERGAGAAATPVPGWARGAAAAGCLALALAAQALLDARGAADGGAAAAWAGGLFAAAAGALALLTRRQPLEAAPADQAALAMQAANPPLRWGALIWAVCLGALAFVRLGGNTFSLDGTALWLGGLCFLLYAGWGPRPVAPAPRRGKKWPTAAALAAIMALGACFRFHRLAEIPLEMGCDLPLNQFNVQDILDGAWPIFFPSYPGREGLFFYLVAPVAAVFGLSHLAIKATAAALGVLTLPAVYWLGRELYDREVGLMAAFLLAISHWHIILTRVGYRAATVPLVLALLWAVLLRALKTDWRPYYLLVGVLLGLGLYTYNAFLIVPLWVAAVAAAEWPAAERPAGRGRALRGRALNLALMALVAAYVFIPLGRYAYDAPESYGYRAATRLTDAETELPANVAGVLADNLWRTAAMFNVQGDGVFVSNVPGKRELGFVSAALFVLGVGLAVGRWRRGYNLTVLAGLGIMCLPSALSIAFPNEVPNAIRAAGALPAAVLLPAAALALLRRTWCAGWAGRARPVAGALGLLVAAGLAAETAAVYPLYFRDYAWAQADHNYSISLTMAQAIDAAPELDTAYIAIWPYWYDGNAVRAQLRRVDPDRVIELEALVAGQVPLSAPAAEVRVLLHPQDAESLAVLQAAFPRGRIDRYTNLTGDESLIVFHGE